MALMQLPTELFQQIIPHPLPEGFECLALTCKYLYTLCTPFLEHYNNLRFHFQKFKYNKTNKDFREFKYHHDLLRFPDTVTSAYSLIFVKKRAFERNMEGDERRYVGCQVLG